MQSSRLLLPLLPLLPLLLAGAGAETSFSCGPSELNGESGEFTSHADYGRRNYPSNHDCTWTVTVPDKSKSVRAEFLDFQVETEANCRNDVLNVFDGSSISGTRVATLCGSRLPGRIQSSGPSLTFRFTTNRFHNFRGFRIRYTAADLPFTCAENEFQCRTGERCIPRSQRCNGRNDCPDRSDEQHCSASCGYNLIPHFPGNGFIVGGRDARRGSWPWQAQLLRYNRHHCGATLLNSRWVVTAAHCLEATANPRSYRILLASFTKHTTDTEQLSCDVEQLISHPRYNRRTVDYDIALLKLTKDVQFNDRIFPACLAESDDREDVGCYTTGWGNTQHTPHDAMLKQALVPLWENSRCNLRQHYNNRITDRMLCAGYPEGGHDACQGDSGGPLVCQQKDGLFQLVGVTSWGSGCALPNKPGVYARVTALRQWLLQQMEQN